MLKLLHIYPFFTLKVWEVRVLNVEVATERPKFLDAADLPCRRYLVLALIERHPKSSAKFPLFIQSIPRGGNWPKLGDYFSLVIYALVSIGITRRLSRDIGI